MWSKHFVFLHRSLKNHLRSIVSNKRSVSGSSAFWLGLICVFHLSFQTLKLSLKIPSEGKAKPTTNVLQTALRIDRFYITSRRSYWCEKQWKGGHVGFPKKSCEIEFFSHVQTFFIPRNLHSCWPSEWKQSTDQCKRVGTQGHITVFIKDTFKFPCTSVITFPKTLLLEDFIDTYASVAFLSSTSYRRHSPCLLTYNPALRKGFGLRWAQHPSRQAESIRCPDNFYPGSRTTWVLWTIKNYHQPRHGSNVLCLMAQPRNGPLLRLVFSREVFLDHYSLQFSLMTSRMRPKESLRLLST